jgi:hypothetical protein
MSTLTFSILAACLGLVALAKPAAAQAPAAAPRSIEALLRAHPDKFGKLLESPETFRVQVLLGEVRDGARGPELVQSGWRVDAEYFYPASTVKLHASVAALERLNETRRAGASKLDERTPLAFQPLFEGESLEERDETNLAGGTITLEHLIRRVLIISENPPFNRLYDVCGQGWLNERMWRAGMPRTRLTHRLEISRTPEQNQRTNAFEWRLESGAIAVAERNNDKQQLALEGVKGIEVGAAHMAGGKRVDKPMSFLRRSHAPLSELQTLVVRISRPDIKLPGEPFDLTDAQRALLLDAMSVFPANSPNPKYDRTKYPDDWVKWFLPGVARVVPIERIKIYNKVGLAYGFVTDTSYIVDLETKRSFFLAATIYVNANGVLNDGLYEYDDVAFPFFASLGEVVARELWAAPVSAPERSK